MAYKLQITHTADSDLDAILSYMLHELQNTEAALHFVNEVEKRYDKLISNPYIYEECRQPLLKSAHYRKVVIGSYLLIYRVDDTSQVVYIERFFSSMQDYAAKL